MDAAEIRLALEKLNVLGRVLYVAAHPDDENTGLIAYWANGALLDAAYLSLTRGDGGQNLTGADLGEALGVIRTQELLAARRIDRGEQFFTRANDFGYSKTAAETLRIWDRDQVLADVVWAIRRFRPDIVVTRFTPEDDRTHGHHTASAQLALAAFEAAGDPKRFPEQLKQVEPWKPARILWNTSPFFFRMREVPFDPAGLIRVEAGGYQPLLGKSYPEIAAQSRTMHKSQGFGSGIDRGERTEYFKHLAGRPVEGSDLFSGIDTTWSRVPGGDAIARKVRAIIAGYDATQPSASVPSLLELRRAVRDVPDRFWRDDKLREIDRLVGAMLGLHLAAITEKPMAQPGGSVSLTLEAMNRSPLSVSLRSFRMLDGKETPIDAALAPNELWTRKEPVQLPPALPLSQPYWLRERGTPGTYTVAEQTQIGQPVNPPAFPVEATLSVAGEDVAFQIAPMFRTVDRVRGEVVQPLVIAPGIFVQLPRSVFVFPDRQPRTIAVRVIAAAEGTNGELSLEAPAGWRVEPAMAPVRGGPADSEETLTFQVTPPADAGEGLLRAFFTPAGGERRLAHGIQRIEYPHIDTQILLPPAEAKLVRADIQLTARKVGYIPGAGDAVAESLRDIGVQVTLLDDAEIQAAHLAQYDAVVLGIRALNVHANRIAAWMPELMAYARRGGVVIVQYNTAPGPRPDQFPASLRISRDRVTDETAEVRLLAPEHPVLTQPNRISKADFAGWVQERGLYFADEWDPAWTPILSSNDPGEKSLDGGLLIMPVGEGAFVYTGYGFFRQLPAGVPGAFRLFSNLLSLGKAAR